MRNKYIDILIICSASLFTVSVFLGVLLARARERAIKAEGMLQGLRSALGMALPQENMTIAIDSIATEVERIGEGQRFLTKVIADQQSHRLTIPRAPGNITPH